MSAHGVAVSWQKGIRDAKCAPTQHKLSDFSTSIRFPKVDNLFGALFPGVFPKKSGLYLEKYQTATEIRKFVPCSPFPERQRPIKVGSSRHAINSNPHSRKNAPNGSKNTAAYLALCTFRKLPLPKRNANGLPCARLRCYDAVAVSGRGEIPHWR